MTPERTTIEHLQAALETCDEAGNTLAACYIQMALDVLEKSGPAELASAQNSPGEQSQKS